MPALEIVGADEIIGQEEYDDYDDYDDDDYDEVEALLGQLPRRRRARPRRGPKRYRSPYSRARGIAAAVKSVEGSTLVRQSAPTKSRALVIGFTQLGIAATASATVTQRPQVLFRPQRIVVPGSLAPSFTVDDVRVGNKSQFISAGAVPA